MYSIVEDEALARYSLSTSKSSKGYPDKVKSSEDLIALSNVQLSVFIFFSDSDIKDTK
jgi:hypothetical protein